MLEHPNKHPINRENLPLVTDAPVEFESKPVEVQDFKKYTSHFRGIYRIYLKLIKEKPKDASSEKGRKKKT